MRIEELSLNEQAKRAITETGITNLYPPQEEAIKAGVLDGKNLVLASPTASGKTLIAELCALKYILEGKGKVLYLTPLRALASEKYDEFNKYSKLVTPNGKKVKVAISTGDYDSADSWLGRYDIIIVTNEKCDSLLRHRADWIEEVTLVIADEIHILNDAHRGPTLEVTLSRLSEINPSIQILALSATVRNASEIANWLKATPVLTDWRPVKLAEGVYLDGECQFNDGSSVKIDGEISSNSAINIALQSIKQGGQGLIFAETRMKTVSIAKSASLLVKKLLSRPEERRLNMAASAILGSGERTKINDLLATLVKNGVAFHHAGLSAAPRKIVEDFFKQGKIKLIAATPTLAAGVNLPARRVVISSYERYDVGYGRYPISVLEYKQMAGRAGRPKYDKIGESVLISRTSDEQDYLMQNYVFAKPERIWSKLAVEKVLRTHVLASIATGFTRSEERLFDFFSKTLCAQQYGLEVIQPLVSKILLFLSKEKMVNLGTTLEPTDFGRRVSEMYLDPFSAVIIRDCLNGRAEHLTNFSYLHMVSHTPDVSPRLYPRRRELDELKAFADIHSAEFMVPFPDEWDDVEYGAFLGEIKSANIIEAWIQEFSEDEIITKFSFEPGDLFRLIDSFDWLLFASYRLCRLFKLNDLLSSILQLRDRVNKGVKVELLQIVGLKGVGRVRGRALCNSGFKSLEDLKHASIPQLLAVPLMGPQLAKRIKEQVGGVVKAEEWSKIKTEREWEQKTIGDF
ncbi:MAG: DEAD/DEAH box helicase [Candidatus Bathyarchaeota archaeon]